MREKSGPMVRTLLFPLTDSRAPLVGLVYATACAPDNHRQLGLEVHRPRQGPR